MQEPCRDLKRKSSNLEIIMLYRLASFSWKDRYMNALAETRGVHNYTDVVCPCCIYRKG